ncbi:MAG: right-handed parallel beta-helix repeat-containing protein [Planctomycetota bacterium]
MRKTTRQCTRPGSALAVGAALLACVGTSRPAVAADIIVPQEVPTITQAVSVASDGDVIVVKDGVYAGFGFRNVDFGGKLITIRSESRDPTRCVIDCQGLGRGFIFQSGETSEAVVEGFTIRDGVAPGGGGIMVIGHCPEVYTTPTIRRCILLGNVAESQRGGGLAAEDCANPIVVDCQFLGNSAPAGGGLSNNAQSSSKVVNTLFSGNHAVITRGGATNTGNASTPNFTNCTFVNNTAALTGGAVFSQGLAANAIVRNSIMWDNEPDDFGASFPATVTVTHSDIQEGAAGEGNISVDPDFVDPRGPDGMPGTGDDDLRLKESSLVIDAADNTRLPAWVEFDLAGDERFVDAPAPDSGNGDGTRPPVDMGAFEFQLFVPCTSDCQTPRNNRVDVTDLLGVLANWGRQAADCDTDLNGFVDVGDLLKVLADWGACP